MPAAGLLLPLRVRHDVPVKRRKPPTLEFHLDGRETGLLSLRHGAQPEHGAQPGVVEILDFERLLRDPPRATRPPAGPLNYPRFAEIYYLAGDRYGVSTRATWWPRTTSGTRPASRR